MLTRSLPRFLIQAALLIVVAAIAAAIHLGPLTILLVVAAAFGIVVGTEWLAMKESKPEPAAVATATARRHTSDPMGPPPAPPVVERRRWNVFDLENRARAIAGKNATRDEEISFLLLYLREFADIDGDLNEEFDTFIRESFPDLLP